MGQLPRGRNGVCEQLETEAISPGGDFLLSPRLSVFLASTRALLKKKEEEERYYSYLFIRLFM